MSEPEENIFMELDNQHYVDTTQLPKAPANSIDETASVDENIIKVKKPRKPRAKKTVDVIFDEVGTEIKGKDFHVLQNKIMEYKIMFKKELKDFKIKKNPTQQDLELALQEMESIVTCSGVDSFITDSILNIIKMTEGITSQTRFNITGCADMLKSNPKFHELCKLLYIKYKVFASVPPEFQLVMIIGTTSYMCALRNQQITAN